MTTNTANALLHFGAIGAVIKRKSIVIRKGIIAIAASAGKSLIFGLSSLIIDPTGGRFLQTPAPAKQPV